MTPQRVHFARSRPAVIPSGPSRKASVDALALEFQKKAVLTKSHHRRRTNSQPQLPVGYVQPNEAGHSGHKHGYVEDPRNPNFRYSTCSGRRKALCIGINYFGQPNELRGCVNDAKHVRRFLIDHGNYKPEDIVILTDDSRDPRSLPTKSNMINAIRWLVKGAKQNDALFFHYSGHGGQTKDLDGDEVDGWDEVIFPMDYQTSGHIVDDTLNEIMVKPLPKGCRLTALFDACHSGTVLGLYSSHARLKGMHVSAKQWQTKATPADVISWSGCMDDQTSADTFQGGVAVGAMSNAFITALTNKPEQTYQELLSSLRKILHPRYSQKPQLGSSHKIDTNLAFIF
ncbi:peptidase C14 [Pholiota molesta]|nr:peptidase C14 [Pholiota molesta]